MGIMNWLGDRAEASNIGFSQKYLEKYILLTRNKDRMGEVAQWMGSDGFALLEEGSKLSPDELINTSHQTMTTADNLIKMDPVSGGIMKLISHFYS